MPVFNFVNIYNKPLFVYPHCLPGLCFTKPPLRLHHSYSPIVVLNSDLYQPSLILSATMSLFARSPFQFVSFRRVTLPSLTSTTASRLRFNNVSPKSNSHGIESFKATRRLKHSKIPHSSAASHRITFLPSAGPSAGQLQ